MDTAKKYIPISQLEKFRSFSTSISDDQLKEQCAMLRWMNKICAYCERNTAIEPNLVHKEICEKCQLFFYCDKGCKEKDHNTHLSECQNVNIPYENIRSVARYTMFNMHTGQKISI